MFLCECVLELFEIKVPVVEDMKGCIIAYIKQCTCKSHNG